MVVSNTETGLESVTVLTELSVVVEMSVSTAVVASVTTAGVANPSITLVIPVVDVVLVIVWLSVAIGAPGEVVSTVDLGVVSIESLDIAWLVVAVVPHVVVLDLRRVFALIVADGPVVANSLSTCGEKHGSE